MRDAMGHSTVSHDSRELLVSEDLATVVTEIVGELLAALGECRAHSTDPPLRPAKVNPRLILLPFSVVGAHGMFECGCAWFAYWEPEYWKNQALHHSLVSAPRDETRADITRSSN
jgi:hypothetical protein